MFKIETILILSLAAYATAIRVPVEDEGEGQTTGAEETTAEGQPAGDDKSIVYIANDDTVDSYLIPPDPHAPDEQYATSGGELGTPATFLLPPLPNASVDYIAPQPQPIQTDWYPILQAPLKPLRYKAKPKALPFVSIPILPPPSEAPEPQPQQGSDIEEVEDPASIDLPVPSGELQPPKEEPADYAVSAPSADQQLPLIESKTDFKIPAAELQLPLIESPPNFNTRLVKELPLKFNLNPAHPTLALHLIPPKPPVLYRYKNPTKLYPKKYVGGFKPIPIPLMDYDEYSTRDVPKIKYVKTYDAIPNTDLVTPDDKKIYEFEKADQKRKLKDEEDAIKQEEVVDAGADLPPEAPESDTDVSETGYSHPGRNRYPGLLGPPRPVPLRVVSQPLRVAPYTAAPAEKPAERGPTAPPPGDRTEFRMHGMNGPHSYQFGYDTGKGKNRQFRYEERDNDGRVHGHYGYMDKRGKLRVVKYEADPERGFHSDAVPDPDDTKPDSQP